MFKPVVAVLALALAAAVPASAAVYTEAGDAPNLFNGGLDPQDVGGGVTIIRGTVADGDEGDLFKLVFGAAGTLQIDVPAVHIDPVIYLFGADGAGIRADDDSGGSGGSRMTVQIVAGTYYLGVGDFIIDAYDLEGDNWQINIRPDESGGGPFVPLPPTGWGTLAHIVNRSGIHPGAYEVTLSLATAPTGVAAPGALGLFGAGLLAMALRRRR